MMFPSFRRGVTALALSLSLALPAAAFDIKAMTPEEQAAFGQAVKGWLLENPDVLIEMSQRLDQQQYANQAANDRALLTQNHDAIFRDGHSWVGGNLDGDVTLVEFIDYRCGYCRKANAEVEELVKSDGNIRFVVKEYPILNEASLISSKFAVAVQQLGTPDQYKLAHDALLAMRPEPSVPALSALAEKLGLDAKAVLARMETNEVAEVIETNHALARMLDIEGTPTFLIKDTFVRGYLPLEEMRKIVGAARS